MTKLVVLALLVATALVAVSAAPVKRDVVGCTTTAACHTFCHDHQHEDEGQCISGVCICRTGSEFSAYIFG
ncbi:hypothetical protein DPMN_074547 [Dreissena polymorpha]|uniref:Defensin n=1 Tax=Dreissena polymorpha TaxID=45954 RepID=A0A9D4BKS1_DREPO|nr:hypothetical protein DPMN_074547 [Dreissena polymorpha]